MVSDDGSWTVLSRFWGLVTHPFLLNVGMFLIPLAFAMWCTYPVWSHDHLFFMGRPTTDNVVTPWFYDFVARRMEMGEELSLLKEFDYPNPHHYSIEFPSDTDARIFAPIAWLLDWPEQWAWTITVVLLMNTFAITLLGRVVGLDDWQRLRPVWVPYCSVRCGLTS